MSSTQIVTCCLGVGIFAAAIAGETPSFAAVLPDTLTLGACFSLSRQNNASMRAACSRIEQTKGEKLESIARMLPHLDLIFNHERRAGVDTSVLPAANYATANQALEILARQRIAEFGPSTGASWDRKQRERSAVLASEDSAATVISTIRRNYFDLQIVNDQIRQHDSLLSLYDLKLTRENDRLSTGIGRKNAVLTARLNILDEKERVLSLESKKHDVCAALKQVCGFPTTDIHGPLVSVLQQITLSEDSCVGEAIGNNTGIAYERFAVEICRQQLLQTGWNFAPNVSLNAGVRSGALAGGITLSQNDPSSEHRWSLDAVGSGTLMHTDSASLVSDGFFTADRNAKYTLSLTVDLPLFRGLGEVGELKEAGARYNTGRNELLAAVRSLETIVRKSWFDYQQARRELDLASERVAIARERYALAESLHELEKISEGDYDSFRQQLFSAQDEFFNQQFQVLETGESLRFLLRRFE